jgi:phage FluMu protein gp41
MIKESGTLVIGVEHGGKVHKDFEMRPQLVKDSIDAMEDERAQTNQSYLGLVILSKQVTRLGDIPKEEITPEVFMEMHDIDLAEIHAASGRLAARLESFRAGGAGQQEGGTGDGEAGVR